MKVVVKAYGKINLFLDVLRKRKDGYHDVKMIMQSVRLHDIVEIKPSGRNSIKTDSLYVPNNKNNLAMKAAMLMQYRYDIPPIAINIKKHIPVSAGMAGGSTDAAAVLLGINTLFNLGCSENELSEIAAQIGSDVPFCLRVGTAIATGRGEQITAINDLPPLHVILIKANFGLSTASVYQSIKENDIEVHKEKFLNLMQEIENQNTDLIINHLYNALEPISERLEKRIKKMKKEIIDAGIDTIHMSGSGPTLFAIYSSQKKAWDSYKIMRNIFPNVYLTSTCTSDLINSRIEIH